MKLPPRAIDLTGQQFGALRVVAYIGKNPNGLCVWSCVCKCGNSTHRDAGKLRYRKKMGLHQCCSECGQKVAYWRRLQERKYYMNLARETDPSLDDDFVAIDVMVSLVEEFGPVDEESFTNDQVDPFFER